MISLYISEGQADKQWLPGRPRNLSYSLPERQNSENHSENLHKFEVHGLYGLQKQNSIEESYDPGQKQMHANAFSNSKQGSACHTEIRENDKLDYDSEEEQSNQDMDD